MKLNSKKGQLESIIVAVILMFVIAILIFASSRITNNLYNNFDSYFDDSQYNNTLAHTNIEGINAAENSSYDYVVLAFVMGVIINLILFSFATRISRVFYWVFGITALLVLFVGAVLSNIWQDLAANPNFATTLTRFPITNALLGNSFVLFITSFVIILGTIIIFGKGAQDQTSGL